MSTGRKISKAWGRPMQVGILLKIPFTRLDQEVERRLHEVGFRDLRPAHHPVFQFLPTDGIRLTELAQRAHVTKQSMGELVRYLERHGYLERVPDPTDSRAQIIRRTPRAWELFDAVDRIIDDVEREWARVMGRKDFNNLIELLGKLCTVLGE